MGLFCGIGSRVSGMMSMGDDLGGYSFAALLCYVGYFVERFPSIEVEARNLNETQSLCQHITSFTSFGLTGSSYVS